MVSMGATVMTRILSSSFCCILLCILLWGLYDVLAIPNIPDLKVEAPSRWEYFTVWVVILTVPVLAAGLLTNLAHTQLVKKLYMHSVGTLLPLSAFVTVFCWIVFAIHGDVTRECIGFSFPPRVASQMHYNLHSTHFIALLLEFLFNYTFYQSSIWQLIIAISIQLAYVAWFYHTLFNKKRPIYQALANLTLWNLILMSIVSILAVCIFWTLIRASHVMLMSRDYSSKQRQPIHI